MKRFLLILVTLGFCLCSSAQIQITTKKEKLSDFPMKTTKVVLTGDESMDQYMKAAMKNIWILSPFEFCTAEEFQANKASEDYYFMVLDTFRHKNEPIANTVRLNIVKGGSGDHLQDMLKVADFPICCTDSTNYHRLDAFLPAIINFLQDYVKESLYKGFNKFRPAGLGGKKHKAVFLAESDLTPELQQYVIRNLADKNILVTDTEHADDMFIAGNDALVSYTFAPTVPQKGSVCYKMIFDARTYELCLFTTHTITSSKKAGLLKKDISKIAGSR